MSYCEYCHEELDDLAAFCPYCGSPNHAEPEALQPERSGRQLIILRLVIWLTLITFILWIALRLLSGVSRPSLPNFGDPELF